jgi:hypothetical protein
MNNEPLGALGIGLLRAVHLWSERHYHRAMMRHALARIGREIVAERRAQARLKKLESGKLAAEVRGPRTGCAKATNLGAN